MLTWGPRYCLAGLTPISPPLVKQTDLLRPVVLAKQGATDEFGSRSRIPSQRSSFPALVRHLRRHPTPIEARAPPVVECADTRPRGLETQSYPSTGLLMTGDVTDGASVVSRLGQGAASNVSATFPGAGRGWASHHRRRAAGPGVPDRARRSQRTGLARSSADSVLNGST